MRMIINFIKKIFTRPTPSRETGLGVAVLSLQNNTLQQVYGPHNLVDRTPVYFVAQGKSTPLPKGISDSEQYYLINVKPTEFNIALTPESKTPVNLQSMGSANLFTGKNPKKP